MAPRVLHVHRPRVLACTLGLFGMTYEKSWPLVMVVVGTSMVARALAGWTSRRRREEEVQHE